MTADVKNMFHQVAFSEKDRTYLRLFWYEDNDPDKPRVEYWSKDHVVGLKSSPSITNYGIRYAARAQPPPVVGTGYTKTT